jgi:hypothetical protein
MKSRSQGTPSRLSLGMLKLASLGANQWSGTAGGDSLVRTSVSQARLDELLVLELRKDGGRGYLTFSIRGLYKFVLTSITNPHHSLQENIRPTVSPPVTVTEPSIHDAEEENSENAGSGSIVADEDEQVTFAVPTETIPPDAAEEAQDSRRAEIVESKPVVMLKDMKRCNRASISGMQPNKVTEDGGTTDEQVAGEGEMTYRDRLGGYLHPRDMRKLTAPFSASVEPELMVRRHVVLLNFDPLRAIILRDRLLILVPDGADSILVQLEQRVRGGTAELENSVFGERSEHVHISDPKETRPTSGFVNIFDKLVRKPTGSDDHGVSSTSKSSDRQNTLQTVGRRLNLSSIKKPVANSQQSYMAKISKNSDDWKLPTVYDFGDEWNEIHGRAWIDIPFELQCIDACLYSVCEILTNDTTSIQEVAKDYIEDILSGRFGLMEDPLMAIRHIKDAIREMRSRVNSFVKALDRILDNDENMALMNLSRLLTHPDRFLQSTSSAILEEEADEVELVLEEKQSSGFTLQNALRLVDGQVDTASDLLDQKQDAIRNRLLFANMIISVFSLCVASASFVGSIFGMNVPIFLEENSNAFRQITISTITGALFLGVSIMSALIWTGTIPRARLG